MSNAAISAPAPPRPVRPALSSRHLAEVAFSLVRDIEQWRPLLDTDPTFRTGLRLVETDDYDAWLLHWPAGTSVEPHDHGESKGVFTVVSGELTELRWHAGRCRPRQVRPGTLVSIPAGVVHDVLSPEGQSLSVHVYAPALVTMRFFDDDGRRLATRWVAEGDPGRAAHPSCGR